MRQGFLSGRKLSSLGLGLCVPLGGGVVIVDGQAQPYETQSFPGPQFLLCYETVPQ